MPGSVQANAYNAVAKHAVHWAAKVLPPRTTRPTRPPPPWTLLPRSRQGLRGHCQHQDGASLGPLRAAVPSSGAHPRRRRQKSLHPSRLPSDHRGGNRPSHSLAGGDAAPHRTPTRHPPPPTLPHRASQRPPWWPTAVYRRSSDGGPVEGLDGQRTDADDRETGHKQGALSPREGRLYHASSRSQGGRHCERPRDDSAARRRRRWWRQVSADHLPCGKSSNQTEATLGLSRSHFAPLTLCPGHATQLRRVVVLMCMFVVLRGSGWRP